MIKLLKAKDKDKILKEGGTMTQITIDLLSEIMEARRKGITSSKYLKTGTTN